MDIIKKIINIKTGIILLALILLIAIGYYINYKINYVNRLINTKRLDWDITLFQNSQTNGEYMGMIYEKDYNIETLPNNLVSVLAANYYVAHDDTFYDEDNYKDNELYEKIITKEEMKETLKNIFGPDYSPNLPTVEYKCGYIKTSADNYIIGSKEPESCGAFGAGDNYYLSYITNYNKDKDKIIIEEKVGYLEAVPEDENVFEEIIYSAYTDKTKKNLISKYYNYDCIYSESDVQEECYTNFKTYLIVLKKGSDHKYHFSEITSLN